MIPLIAIQLVHDSLRARMVHDSFGGGNGARLSEGENGGRLREVDAQAHASFVQGGHVVVREWVT